MSLHDVGGMAYCILVTLQITGQLASTKLVLKLLQQG
jgi:hypothetical protein